ncbi:PB1 domain containing protein [Musa troglodytarum]|uniref:PB1 domain containing protein n=1 Tax=Musa troglodytarum TaxID=320322 RepID=A0A9E7EY04_9LILI|nr:PB1 domain containing protein [Musa troglodytarum]
MHSHSVSENSIPALENKRASWRAAPENPPAISCCEDSRWKGLPSRAERAAGYVVVAPEGVLT